MSLHAPASTGVTVKRTRSDAACHDGDGAAGVGVFT